MQRTLAALALAAALLGAAPAQAHRGSPDFLTRVDRITPATDGIRIDVINRDDSLELVNDSGEDVVLEGYDDEPYARIDADGTVAVNTRSPAYHLNDERYGDVEVPDGVDGSGAPDWKVLRDDGRFTWHDHRMHWMSEEPPEAVRDVDERREVFEWDIPMTVGGEPGEISGTLFWTPGPATPVAFIVVGSVVVLGGCAAALVAARRRRTGEPSEAW